MMPDSVKDEVKRQLVEALGERGLLWEKADLLPYCKDTYRVRFEDEYRYMPDFVVLPETTEEVKKVVSIAASRKIPLIPKGGGSNRTGMLVPTHGGIVVDTIRMNKLIEISVPDLCVTVQPGMTLKDLGDGLAEHGLWLTQEQGSLKMATVGGAISTSAFSRRHQKYGAMADCVMSLEVVLADGSVLRTGPKVLYTSTGYRLHQLFIGAEGTLGIITEATLRVEPLPEAQEVVLGFFDDFWAAIDAAKRVMASGVDFSGGEAYEIVDHSELRAPPDKKALFYALVHGTKEEVQAVSENLRRTIEGSGGILADHEVANQFLTTYTKQWCGARALTGYEDVLTTYVPMEKMRQYYDTLWNEIAPKYGIEPLPGEKYSLDVGKYRMAGGRYRLPKGDRVWERYQEVLKEIAALATGLGGSVQACHGVGIQHRDNMVLEYSDVALEAMRGIKHLLDPDNIMNPGKKIPEKE
ncbi:MAG: FAD-binding oxidoreductase [Candidatus Thermoplasmatota archaeon]|nr:FAD-binding oxidoreductase [Candidatus Thermoplasmatota archaeon]